VTGDTLLMPHWVKLLIPGPRRNKLRVVPEPS
jgi:hypothetical protein